jgi:large subunit ribosomal protein L15
MPLQRRVPKFGFTSRGLIERAEVRLDALAKIDAEVIDLPALKAARLVPAIARRAKIIASGDLNKAVSVKGLGVTKGARSAIEAAGGSIELAEPQQTDTERKRRQPNKR